jgi:ribosomal protein L11 methyltransferase
MPWLQLKFSTTQEYVEPISDWMMELGALSLTYQDAEDNPILEPLPGETPLWDDLIVSALFDAGCDTDAVLRDIGQSQYQAHIQNPVFEQLEDKDWERAWMDNFHPMRFGQGLWIVPSWHQPPDPNAVNIMLDPGLAFGTGTHPTTALCLEWLDAADVADKRVLDYGCGSGILAIAAAKLKAQQVIAIDIDPQALLATRDNMQRNGIAPSAIVTGKPNIAEGQQFDLVLANILAGPLRELSASIAEKVRPGGMLVLSGLLAQQAEEISQCYEKWFNMKPAVMKEDWIRLEGIKR